MYKIIKRSFSIALFVIFALMLNIFVVATNNDYTEVLLDGDPDKFGRYYVEETIEENALPYGVSHRTDISFSSAGTGMCTTTAAGLGNNEPFVPGKFYPQQINVLEVPSTTDVRITTWSSLTPTKWTLTSVRNIASEYEQKNPGYRVIAAINADFFDISGRANLPYATSGAHVSNGEYIRPVTSRAAVGFKNDGSSNPLVGNQTLTRSKMILGIYDENNQVNNEFFIDRVNQVPQDGEVAIYYANYNSDKQIVPIEVENAFIVKQGEQVYAYSNDHFYGRGTISATGSQTLSEGDFAIVSNNSEVSAILDEGVRIRAQYEFTGAYAGITDATGVGRTILADGVPVNNDTARHPRTMIGMKEDGTIIMTVVDGRQATQGMYGATQIEMAAVLKHYGAVEGYNLDGGGSSTMLILKDGDFEVVNSPSDGRERSTANAILVVAKVPDIDYSVSDITDSGFVVNAEVKDYNGFEFDDLYVGVEDQYQKVDGGQAVFTNLKNNRLYGFSFYRKVDGDYQAFVIQDQASTAKITPEINVVYMFYQNDNVIFEFSFYDPDQAVVRREMYVGNQSQLIFDNRATFSSNVELKDLYVALGYNLNDGNGRQDMIIRDFKAQCKLEFFMQIVHDTIKSKTINIYE